jgi:hypothetical protein
MIRGGSYFRRVVGGAVLLPLVLFAASFAHDLMRCQVTGRVVETCACPDENPTGPAVDTQSCCERETVEALSAGRTETAASPFVGPDVILTRIAPTAPSWTGRCSAMVRTFRPPGPALVLVKHSFLI